MDRSNSRKSDFFLLGRRVPLRRRIAASRVEDLLGELDVVEDDKWSLNIEHCPVVNAGRDVVVTDD